jgi:ATP-dependent helicase/nuclease subunit B
LRALLAHNRARPLDDVVVIVPSARYKSLLEERLLKLVEAQLDEESAGEYAGIFGVKIMPFYRVCQLVLHESAIEYSILPDNLRAVLLSRVLVSMKARGELSVLSAISGFKGTASSVLNLIDEFQRAALTPEAVLLKLGETAAEESKIIELARIYEAYWRELKRVGYVDQHMLAFSARKALFDSNCQLSLDWVIADGFDRFNRLQLQVLSGLSRHAGRTTITFDFVDQSRSYYEGYRQDYTWKDVSYQQLLTQLEPALMHVDPPERTKKTAVVSTLDRYFEMDEIARRCKRLIAEDRARTGDLLVVARDLKSYRAIIETAFDDAGLPYFIDDSVSIAELPVVQFCKALFNLAAGEFSRAEVLSCLRSKYCNLAALNLSASDVDLIDQLSLKNSIVGGAERWCAMSVPAERQAVKEGLKRLVDFVSPAHEMKTYTEFSVWTEDLLDSLLALPATDEGVTTAGDSDASQGFAGIRQAIRGAVEEEKVLGPQLASYEIFLQRLMSAIDESNFRRRPRHKWPITICGADFAPNRCFDHVFIAGLLEGEFPRRSGSSGFASPDELAKWAGFGVEMHNPRHHPGFELALYRTLEDRARKEAHLSFPRYEMSGGDELVPSFFVTGGESKVEKSIPFLPPFSSSVNPVSVRDALACWLWAAPDFDASWQWGGHDRVSAVREEIESPLSVACARAEGPRQSVFNGYLAELVNAGALAVQAPAVWSASKLNSYGQCPFKFWVSNLLGWERQDEPQSGLDARLLGQTYHKALELFFATVVARQLKVREVESPVRDELFEDALRGAIRWLEAQPEFSPGPFWTLDQLELKYRLQRFLNEEIGRLNTDAEPLEPAKFEVGFGIGGDNSYPPLPIEFAGKTVLIRGVVDRIDLVGEGSGQRARVVDYKSGSTSISSKDALNGRNLQIPIYALAVERVILPGSRVVKGSYLSVGSGRPVGQLDFEKDEGLQLLRVVEAKVQSIVAGVEAGDFTVRPSAGKVCKQCSHEKVCRIGELTTGEMESDRLD